MLAQLGRQNGNPGNNLFSSEEEVREWLKLHPDLAGRPVFGVQEFLDRRRSGVR